MGREKKENKNLAKEKSFYQQQSLLTRYKNEDNFKKWHTGLTVNNSLMMTVGLHTSYYGIMLEQMANQLEKVMHFPPSSTPSIMRIGRGGVLEVYTDPPPPLTLKELANSAKEELSILRDKTLIGSTLLPDNVRLSDARYAEARRLAGNSRSYKESLKTFFQEFTSSINAESAGTYQKVGKGLTITSLLISIGKVLVSKEEEMLRVAGKEIATQTTGLVATAFAAEAIAGTCLLTGPAAPLCTLSLALILGEGAVYIVDKSFEKKNDNNNSLVNNQHAFFKQSAQLSTFIPSSKETAIPKIDLENKLKGFNFSSVELSKRELPSKKSSFFVLPESPALMKEDLIVELKKTQLCY